MKEVLIKNDDERFMEEMLVQDKETVIYGGRRRGF